MYRDFDKEKILDKMRALKDKRDLEIMKEQFDKDTEMDEKLQKNKVLDVKYLGKVDEIGDVFLLTEQRENENGDFIEIERYENEDGEVIAGNNKADNFDFILLSSKYQDNQELLGKIEELDKEGILDLNQIEEERLESIAKELGVKAEDLKRVAEIDPKKEINIKETEKGTENNTKIEENKTLSQEELKNIPSKTTIELGKKVTDKETVASLFKIENKGYKRVEVVESDKLNNDSNGTRFSLVGIKEIEKTDGTKEEAKEEVAEKIETLEQRYGNKPTKKINVLNGDGSKIEEKPVDSIYQVKGDNENQVALNINQLGTMEVYYARTPRQNNGDAIAIPIETHSIRPTTGETREFMNKQKNNSVKEEIERIKQHKEAGCEEIKMQDINDNPYDNTHEHIDKNDAYLDELADIILENDKIASTYNRQDVKNRLVKQIEEKGGKLDREMLINSVESEMEQDAYEEHEQPWN